MNLHTLSCTVEKDSDFIAVRKAETEGAYETMAESAINLLNKFPDHGIPYILLGDTYRKQNYPKLAIETYREAVVAAESAINNYWTFSNKPPDFPGDPKATGQDYVIHSLLELLSAIGISTRALYNIGSINKNIGNKQAAVYYYEKASSVMSDCVQALFNAALVYTDQEQYENASIILEKCVHMDADFAEAWGLLGITYFELNRLEDSIAACKRAQILRSDLTDLHLLLGFSYQILERFPEAIESFEAAIADDPEYVEAYGSLGLAFMATGDIEKAIEALTHALALNPAYPEAYYSLGLAYFMCGDFIKGREIWKYYCRSYPDNYENSLSDPDSKQ